MLLVASQGGHTLYAAPPSGELLLPNVASLFSGFSVADAPIELIRFVAVASQGVDLLGPHSGPFLSAIVASSDLSALGQTASLARVAIGGTTGRIHFVSKTTTHLMLQAVVEYS